MTSPALPTLQELADRPGFVRSPGNPLALHAVRRTEIRTPWGLLVPRYRPDEPRRSRVKSLLFHPDGSLKSLPLQARTPVDTPAGPVDAELLTFHPGGALRRVFPTDGELSGFWTWEDEMALCRPLSLRTPLGRMQRRVLTVNFYESGRMKSLTLWPGDTVELSVGGRAVRSRIGVAFHEHGPVRRFEPAQPLPLATAVGTLTAFDPDALGLHGDEGSVALSPSGEVEEMVTATDRIEASGVGFRTVIEPGWRPGACDPDRPEPAPMRLILGPDALRVVQTGPEAGPVRTVPYAGTLFRVFPAHLFARLGGLPGEPGQGLRAEALTALGRTS